MSKRKLMLTALLMLLAPASSTAAITMTVSDSEGAAARIAAPVVILVDLEKRFGSNVSWEQLQLHELAGPEERRSQRIPVQFEPIGQRRLYGKLWWLMPPGQSGSRRFELSMGTQAAAARLDVRRRDQGRYLDIAEGTRPVLRYNHGTVPVPSTIASHYARGDYISPLFGPDGEQLTEDYPADHPHHRGVSWSWPVVRWGDEVRDIWAVQGVWARPVAVRRCAAGPVVAIVEAESVWKWNDKEPIVREEVVIHAFGSTSGSRVVDVQVQLTALREQIAIGGRPQAGYGGFGLRAAPGQQRQILLHQDGPGSQPPAAWLDYSANFSGGKGRSGVAIFEHVTNPGYPNPLHQYPHCNYVMPAFPGSGEVALSTDQPLVLKHRLWIHRGQADESTLRDVWTTYAKPPQVKLSR